MHVVKPEEDLFFVWDYLPYTLEVISKAEGIQRIVE
jgi:hypothetical protein